MKTQFSSICEFAVKLLVTAEGRLMDWKGTAGQDLTEYALMAGFVAVAGGAISPNIATSISTIISKVTSVMTAAGTQPS
jgi:Flp pilus assembly pilin Flp